jgi:8-oxo-dGTP pyrophosphatase MutT (NUDIX family)
MGYEISAGVILFRRQPRREFLILDYGSHWDFPKGHIERGEDALAAAQRELHEETGIQDFRLVPGYVERMRYIYRRAGEQMRKDVIYYLAETTGDETVRLSHEHRAYAWVSYEEGLQRLTFKTARELLERAHVFLEVSPQAFSATQATDPAQ